MSAWRGNATTAFATRETCRFQRTTTVRSRAANTASEIDQSMERGNGRKERTDRSTSPIAGESGTARQIVTRSPKPAYSACSAQWLGSHSSGSSSVSRKTHTICHITHETLPGKSFNIIIDGEKIGPGGGWAARGCQYSYARREGTRTINHIPRPSQRANPSSISNQLDRVAGSALSQALPRCNARIGIFEGDRVESGRKESSNPIARTVGMIPPGLHSPWRFFIFSGCLTGRGQRRVGWKRWDFWTTETPSRVRSGLIGRSGAGVTLPRWGERGGLQRI